MVAANKDYLVPISGCLRFDRTSKFLEKSCNIIKKNSATEGDVENDSLLM